MSGRIIDILQQSNLIKGRNNKYKDILYLCYFNILK